MLQARVKKALNYIETPLMHEEPLWPLAPGVALELQESRLHCCEGWIHLVLKGVMRLTMLPIFGDVNTMGVVLKRKTKRSFDTWPLPWQALATRLTPPGSGFSMKETTIEAATSSNIYSLVVVVVCTPEWFGGWAQPLHLPSGYPAR